VGPHTYDDDVTVTLPNFRDVGGVVGLDGASVRHGLLLRSGVPEPTDTVPDGTPWPPALVVDLRSSMEHGDVHPLAPLGARVVSYSLLASLAPGWHENTPTLRHLYGQVLDTAAPLLASLVDDVADTAAQGGATLVHCAAGKDRTGISVALLLRLLGVHRDDVVADYLLTEHATAAIDARLRAPGSDHPVVPAAFLTVPREAIELVLDRWEAHPGGIEGWFASAGGDPRTVERLRSAALT
jgi:hypothetical protein